MAKVMISFPDSLLERIDAHVRAHRTTRSGFIQEAAKRDLDLKDEARRERIRELLADPIHHEGDSVEYIRKLRWSR